MDRQPEVDKLAGDLAALDPVFAEMAARAGKNLWGLSQLTPNEKTILCLSADLCHPHLGLPMGMHLTMARQLGVEPATIREILRHLGPYVGYPILVPAFQRLHEIGIPIEDDPAPLSSGELEPEIAELVVDLAEYTPGLAEFTEELLIQRWTRPHLSLRERAIACLAVDVHYQTLDMSFGLHTDLAIKAGADRETLDDVLRGLAEFGLTRSWRAARALVEHLRG